MGIHTPRKKLFISNPGPDSVHDVQLYRILSGSVSLYHNTEHKNLTTEQHNWVMTTLPLRLSFD